MAKRTKYNRDYRKANLDRLLKKHRDYRRQERKRYPDKNWHMQLKSKFGLTVDQYNQKLIEQNGVCAICKKPEVVIVKGKLRRLGVDHNHETNQIRSLLCLKCNMGLGAFLESKELMLSAIQYLKYYESVEGGGPNGAGVRPTQ